MVMSDGHSIICWRAIHIAVKLDSSGAYPTVPELWKELPVKGFKPDSAMHGTINNIANRLMAVSERSSLAGAFKRVLIHDILRWKAGGSNPSVPMWLDSYQLAGNWRMPCEYKNHHARFRWSSMETHMERYIARQQLRWGTPIIREVGSIPALFAWNNRSKQGCRMVVQIHLRT